MHVQPYRKMMVKERQASLPSIDSFYSNHLEASTIFQNRNSSNRLSPVTQQRSSAKRLR